MVISILFSIGQGDTHLYKEKLIKKTKSPDSCGAINDQLTLVYKK